MCVDNSPCEFTCTNGYTTSPSTDCVCEVPNVVCNGNGVASGACPSSQTTIKKRWVGSGSCKEKGYGWAACGVFGRGSRAWECFNTARDLESCECPWPSCRTYHSPFFYYKNFKWWIRVPPDAFLADRPRLHCPPRCRRCLLSLWRVCRPPLYARIRPVARRHTLHSCTGSHFPAPRRHARGRRSLHTKAVYVQEEQEIKQLQLNFFYICTALQ